MATYFETTIDGVKASPPTLQIYTGEGSSEAIDTNLEAVRLTWGINGRVTTFEFFHNLGGGPGGAVRSYPEDELDVATSEAIRLVAVVGSVETDLFIGNVGQISELYQGEQEALSFVAYGPEILLANTAIHGQWHAKPDTDEAIINGTVTIEDTIADNTFQSDLPVIFNPEGKPNASSSNFPWLLGSGAGASVAVDERVFDDPDRRVIQPDSSGVVYEAEHWTAYTALKSMLAVFSANSVVDVTAIDALSSDLDLPISDVSIEGLTLLQAIARILNPVGYGFTIQPWKVGGLHTLVIFPLHSNADTIGPNIAGGSAGSGCIECGAR